MLIVGKGNKNGSGQLANDWLRSGWSRVYVWKLRCISDRASFTPYKEKLSELLYSAIMR